MKKIVLLIALSTMAPLLFAKGDPQLGEQKAALCMSCHGAKGISSMGEWPNLAGQHEGYLIKQLQDFKGKTRPSAVMTPLVATLSDADMADIAAYYASLPPGLGMTPKAYLARGQQLYRGGDFDKHITACIACHGPKGTGNGEANFPLLSGQQAPYTVAQLQAFKDNKRSNDLNSIMRDISARMDNDDMQAVAYYIAGLH